jgi:hypothetical protein
LLFTTFSSSTAVFAFEIRGQDDTSFCIHLGIEALTEKYDQSLETRYANVLSDVLDVYHDFICCDLGVRETGEAGKTMYLIENRQCEDY